MSSGNCASRPGKGDGRLAATPSAGFRDAQGCSVSVRVQAWADVTSRIGPGQTVQDVVRSLEDTCSTTQQQYPDLTYSITIDKVDAMPAFSVPKDAYIVKRLNKAYSEIRPDSPPQPTGALAPQCFYGSDAGHLYKSLGMEGVVCGPGGKYNTMPDERVEVS